MSKSYIHAEIIADSINVATGDRLTTFRIRAPKFLLAEFNTHRAISKNWASSRAIPAKKVRQQVIQDPFIFVEFGANQKGMQATQQITGWRLFAAKQIWLKARYAACFGHWLGEKIGIHKQVINRLVEPWMWVDGVATATEWNNFFALRAHPDAQPEFKELASSMLLAYKESKPEPLGPGEWHLPFISQEEITRGLFLDSKSVYASEMLSRTSTARCARVSYLLRDRQEHGFKADLQLCERLMGSEPKHLSPAEHPAMALESSVRCGNFVGWKQYRKFQENESGGDYLNSFQ